MIKLSRLNGVEFWINQDHIVSMMSTPETVLTLDDGVKLTVKETPQEVVERVLGFRRLIVPPLMDQDANTNRNG
jgi:flagellar protein FlbD